MLERTEGTLRPGDLLDDFLVTFGYGDNRIVEGSDSACFVYVREYVDDEPVDHWLLSGVGEDPRLALIDAFGDMMTRFRDDRPNGRLGISVEGIALVSFGIGMWATEDDDGEIITVEERLDRGDVPDDVRIELASRGVRPGEVLCRVVNVITHAGLVGEVTFDMGEGIEPLVERQEQWLFDGEGNVPVSQGVVDDALMAVMTFCVLLREIVSRDLPMTARSLFQIALDDGFGQGASTYVLRVIADAIDAGIIGVGELGEVE